MKLRPSPVEVRPPAGGLRVLNYHRLDRAAELVSFRVRESGNPESAGAMSIALPSHGVNRNPNKLKSIGAVGLRDSRLGARGSHPQRGQAASVKTWCSSPRSLAAGVTIDRSPTTIFRPCFMACLTSSSHTKSTGLDDVAADGDGADGEPGAGVGAGAGAGMAGELVPAGAEYPREARNWSIRLASGSAARPAGASTTRAFGNCGPRSAAPAGSFLTTAGVIS